MNPLVPYLWVAGGIHLIIVASNVLLPKKLHYWENLPKLSPIVRQIFVVHSVYIGLVLTIFSALCFFFAQELAGGSLLGRFLSGCIALFWLIRIPLQLFYYDPEIRRENRLVDVGYTLAMVYSCVVFLVAASGSVK